PAIRTVYAERWEKPIAKPYPYILSGMVVRKYCKGKVRRKSGGERQGRKIASASSSAIARRAFFCKALHHHLYKSILAKAKAAPDDSIQCLCDAACAEESRTGMALKKFKDLSEKEILALAISSEEEDGRIYGEFADALRDSYPNTAQMFEEMRA